ncbi:hypothetical protein V9T40_009313 [Parthenolecanium corni]|uniref:Nitrogen permease regulator 2-like protein n=1 Tax=Parthenolecanium corni TaxID=536013 RepID=A0AAN9TQ77_9HEMI
MLRPSRFYEGCGRDGPIRCIFLCEFHPTAGPKIVCQVPEDYMSKDDFESVSVYIIPKAQLFKNVITITVFGFKILGFPTRIDDKVYARNAYCFNLCFVFDAWARSVHYENIVKKLTDFLMSLEITCRFISQLANNKSNGTQLVTMLNQVMNDLNTHKYCVLSGPKVITHLKVVQIRPDPPPISDCEVPVLLDSKESFHSDRWDLTTMQILPYINGVNHVKKISAMAGVNNNLVKSCLQNLVYYGVVCMIPIFLYSSMYAVTPKLRKLAVDKKLQEECILALTRTGKESAQIRDIFCMYSNMKSGVTMKDLCIRFNPLQLNIDERSLVEFGILEGFIRRIHEYPVNLETSMMNDVPYSQYLTGEYSTDSICCMNEISLKQLHDSIESYPNIVFICK